MLNSSNLSWSRLLMLVFVIMSMMLVSLNLSEIAEAQSDNLTIWWWGQQEVPKAGEWLEESIDLYKKANPDVKFETVLQTTDQLYPAFRAAAAAGEGPDINYFWNGIWILEDVWAGNIAPFSKYATDSALNSMIDTKENLYQGEYWSSPWYLALTVMPYNKEMFADAGLDPESPPETWDEFLYYCEQLKQAGYTPLSLGFKDGWQAGWFFSLVTLQHLNTVDEVKEVAVGKRSFTDPKFKDWLEKLYELKEKGYLNENILSVGIYEGQQMFRREKAAMTVVLDGLATKWANEMGQDKVGFMGFPSVVPDSKWGSVVTVTAQTLGIASFSNNKELAGDFLSFLHSKDRVNAWYTTTGNLPADTNLDKNLLNSEKAKKLYNWAVETDPHIENFIPTMIDSEGVFVAAQNMFAQNKKPDELAEFIEKVAKRWRMMKPDVKKQFEKWIAR